MSKYDIVNGKWTSRATPLDYLHCIFNEYEWLMLLKGRNKPPSTLSSIRSAAVNLPFSERRAMIFSLLLPVFLLPFEVFSLLFTVFSLLFSLQNLHKILLHVDVDCAVAGEGTASFAVMTISETVNFPFELVPFWNIFLFMRRKVSTQLFYKVDITT